MATLTDGMDVASAGELNLALAAGVTAAEISFAGPGKSDSDLTLAITSGCLLNLESLNEAGRVAAIGKRLGLTPRVALRLNPDFELRSAGMRMGGGARPFGIDVEIAPAALHEIAALGLQCEGLHIFSGSQSLKADAIAASLEHAYALAERLMPHFTTPLRELTLGGGFGIPYFPGEEALDPAPITAALARILNKAKHRMAEAALNLELGRYLVGEAGFYVTRIVDRKVSRGQTFLITAGGMNHHLAASGNLGQVLRKNYPIAIGNRFTAATEENANVCGPLCSPLDILAENYLLPRADIGDLVVVFQSGAYGASASPQGFLSHEPLKEVMV
jgi:diaminopimelate decarboxylase